MRSTHVANLSQQNCPEQFSEDVCATALVFFQDKIEHTLNNLLRRNLETASIYKCQFPSLSAATKFFTVLKIS